MTFCLLLFLLYTFKRYIILILILFKIFISSRISLFPKRRMTSVLYPILSLRFPHERDKNICFQEEGHKYTILTDPDSTYTSVTTWNHSHFGHFNADEIIRKMMSSKSWKEGHKYWGLTGEEIKDQWNNNRDNAAGAGTQLHFEIECFMNSNLLLFQYTHLELIQFYDKIKN